MDLVQNVFQSLVEQRWNFSWFERQGFTLKSIISIVRVGFQMGLTHSPATTTRGYEATCIANTYS